jgi:hypothetical protein
MKAHRVFSHPGLYVYGYQIIKKGTSDTEISQLSIQSSLQASTASAASKTSSLIYP